MKVLRDPDVQPDLLKSKRIALIGFGSQAHAHALNLRDSGHDVAIGLRKDSRSWDEARGFGLDVYDTAVAVRRSDIVILLIPDEVQQAVYTRDIEPNLRRGAYLGFAHGFSIHYRKVVPAGDVNVFLVAPKGTGPMVRQQFEMGNGVPGFVAVHQDPSGDTRNIALAYACALGCGRIGIIETTFREETETDLFGEQAVMCGGLTELIHTGFETLVSAGYSPEVAYFECLHEVKLIADLIYERGIVGMRQLISNTAEFGDVTRGKRVIGDGIRQAMKEILADIQSGKFADQWMAEYAAGKPTLKARAEEDSNHPVEQVGKELRKLMPWLQVSGLAGDAHAAEEWLASVRSQKDAPGA